MSTTEDRKIGHSKCVDALHKHFALVSWVWTATR